MLACEPTRRSVGVFRQYAEYATSHDVTLRVLGNKIADELDVEYLREEIGTDLLGCLTQSSWVRAAERGSPRPIGELEPANVAVLDAALAALDARGPRDWAAYHRNTIEFHRRNARAWANSATGTDLMDQVDPDCRADLATAEY